MTDFTVAITDLQKDIERFSALGDRFTTFGRVMGSVADACVDDWGFWETYKEAVTAALGATKEHSDSAARELKTTSTTLAAVRATYIQEEEDNTHAATQLS